MTSRGKKAKSGNELAVATGWGFDEESGQSSCSGWNSLLLAGKTGEMGGFNA